ncbi:hypothetical protein F4778DRAFT_177981 [Xylariomycetidae sp. FL2044]|nr:hypothetical protein F4778DRAFT_177981 [Xylariomycetidae sp. FL2044]
MPTARIQKMRAAFLVASSPLSLCVTGRASSYRLIFSSMPILRSGKEILRVALTGPSGRDQAGSLQRHSPDTCSVPVPRVALMVLTVLQRLAPFIMPTAGAGSGPNSLTRPCRGTTRLHQIGFCNMSMGLGCR